MAILSIRTFGDPVLRSRADEVTRVTEAERRLVEDMFETMRAVRGVGLAAPQVGVGLRLFVWDVDGESGHVLNPVITSGTELQGGVAEGCLSVPGIGSPLERFQETRLQGRDLDGDPVDVRATGMLARCFQHETDHLDGVLFINRLEGELKKEAFRTLRNGAFDSAEARVTGARSRNVGASFGLGGQA